MEVLQKEEEKKTLQEIFRHCEEEEERKKREGRKDIREEKREKEVLEDWKQIEHVHFLCLFFSIFNFFPDQQQLLLYLL